MTMPPSEANANGTLSISSSDLNDFPLKQFYNKVLHFINVTCRKILDVSNSILIGTRYSLLVDVIFTELSVRFIDLYFCEKKYN